MDALFRQRIGEPDPKYHNTAIDIRPQPFLNNELVGGHITPEVFDVPESGGCILYITPSYEPDNVHIVMLSHFDGETLYLVRADVADCYFGNSAWDLCCQCEEVPGKCVCPPFEEADDTPSITVITIPHDMEPRQLVTRSTPMHDGEHYWSVDDNTGSFSTARVCHRSLEYAVSSMLLMSIGTSPERLYFNLWDPFTGHRVPVEQDTQNCLSCDSYMPNYAYICKNALFTFADIRKHPSPHDLLDPGITSHGWWEPCTDGILGTTWFPGNGTIILWTIDGPVIDK